MAGKNVLTITEQNFEQEVLNSDVPVLLDFWAVWCGPCRMIAPTVEQLSDELDGKIKVGKVNIDEENELAARFGVSSIPTLLVFKDGKLSKTLVGIQQADSLKKQFS